jgi:2-keto-3-deoxy-L-rhamnonate aldolase RhmA
MGVERCTSWGLNTAGAKHANLETMVIPLIETVDAGRNIEAILRVPDIDGFFFGPADYSASAGYVGEWEGPKVAEELLRLKDQIRAHGLPCGIVSKDDGSARIQQGFQMIGLGVDCTMLAKTIQRSVESLGKQVDPAVWSRASSH